MLPSQVLAPARSAGGGSAENTMDRLLSCLLTEMDGVATASAADEEDEVGIAPLRNPLETLPKPPSPPPTPSCWACTILAFAVAPPVCKFSHYHGWRESQALIPQTRAQHTFIHTHPRTSTHIHTHTHTHHRRDQMIAGYWCWPHRACPICWTRPFSGLAGWTSTCSSRPPTGIRVVFFVFFFVFFLIRLNHATTSPSLW